MEITDTAQCRSLKLGDSISTAKVRKLPLVTELTGGLQIQNSIFIEIHIFTFQKNLKKSTYIHEGITHMCVNFQGKIR